MPKYLLNEHHALGLFEITGSNAANVVQHAKCSVLVVRARP